MKISADKQKEILLNSFNTLKNNVNNIRSYYEIISKMYVLDSTLAIDMWEFLLKKFITIVKSDGYYLTEAVTEKIGASQIAEILFQNDFLKRTLFGQSSYLSFTSASIVAYYINTKQLYLANDLLELVQKNGNKEILFSEFFISVIEYVDKDIMSDEVLKFFMGWINQIDNEEGRALINVKLLNLL